MTIILCEQVCCHASNYCFSSCHTRVVCLQVLEAGALKPLIEHMNGQQFSWLQGLVSGKAAEGRAAEAPAVTCFLAGCSFQGFRYSPAYYGCLVPYMPVSVLPLIELVCGSVIGTYLKHGTLSVKHNQQYGSSRHSHSHAHGFSPATSTHKSEAVYRKA